jgi:TolB-like protein
MADMPDSNWSDADREAVRAQVERINRSGPFAQSPRRQKFIAYVVGETLAGRGDRLKGYQIAVDVFGRPGDFDPNVDPIVRVEAARVREKLREYYETEGRSDAVRIELPKGSYTPHIEMRRPQEGDLGSLLMASQETRSLPSPMFSWSNPRMTAGVAAAALLLLLAMWNLRHGPVPATTAGTDTLTLAVLPFDNIGGDPAWGRLADGMTQDITTDLSQSKDLLIIARNSTERYRAKTADVRDIGRDLGVRYVLEGSIQPGDNRVQVTAQLIDARSGEHVWTTRYNRPVTDIFDVQSSLTEEISATLAGYEGAVANAERKLIRRKPPSVLTAYENYLLGMAAKHGGVSGGVSKEGLDEAERLFLKAVERDPQLARAYVGLAYVFEYRLDLNLGSPSDNVARLIEVANKAARLDPNDGEAQMVLGHAYVYQGLTEQALQQFAKAEALAPSNADVLILIAWYLPQLDQSRRAVALAERALRLNPNYPAWYNQALRYVYFCNSEFDNAVKFVKLVPNPNPLDYAYLSMALAMLGDTAGAKQAGAELNRRDPAWNVEAYLSDNGGFPEHSASMFVNAARKAGIAACAPIEATDGNSAFIRLNVCDVERQTLERKILEMMPGGGASPP